MSKEKYLFIEPFSGVAGDMFTAALLGLGADCPEFWQELKKLPLKEDWNAVFTETARCGIQAGSFSVTVEEKHSHRTLEDIEKIIKSAKLSDGVTEKALAVFRKLAEAEGSVHGKEIKYLHFHEVGASDAVIDIVGACIALEILGIDFIVSSPVALGKGTIKSAHGILPVPVPATMKILEGIPVRYTGISAELATPTGAALITVLSDSWSELAQGTVYRTACGAGRRELEEQPNILRASLFTPSGGSQTIEQIGVLECNMDDFSGENFSWIGPELMKQGAYDYAIIPVTAKKGRPGIILQLLCSPCEIGKFADFILKETSSLGVRYRLETRKILNRELREIKTPWGDVIVKYAMDEDGNCLKYKLEYESCALLAESTGTAYSIMYKQVSNYLEGLGK